jgi:4,5-dihydroxyphthalate decarboxylase
MSRLSLSIAMSNYEHVSDVMNGHIHPEGIDLMPMELPVEEIFFRMLNFLEWDVSEFSMAKYVSLVAADKAPFWAIPVFPSRVFRQSAFYVASGSGIEEPADLAGRRVGIPEWAQTAGVYARSYLQHQCGMQLKDIHWVQAGVNDSGRSEKVKLSLPSGVAIETVSDRSLNDLLLAGEIDAMISAREPASFIKRDPRIARLWPDYRTVEEDYYKNTGIFPIMHAVVIKKETLEQHPWIAMNLFKVFEEAKKRSLQRLSSLVNSRVAIPWSHIAVERAQTLFGEDVWPYGIEANRCTLEAFTQFCFEQGVTDRRVPLSELFPPQLTKTYKA